MSLGKIAVTSELLKSLTLRVTILSSIRPVIPASMYDSIILYHRLFTNRLTSLIYAVIGSSSPACDSVGMKTGDMTYPTDNPVHLSKM